MLRLYEQAYPGNWVNPRMLEAGQYFGMRKEEKLVSVAGVYLCPKEYKVASLRNVVTHPAYTETTATPKPLRQDYVNH
jgi:hypothetical protein